MISDEVVQRIRRYRSEGVSLREISRATGISVNTIRRYRYLSRYSYKFGPSSGTALLTMTVADYSRQALLRQCCCIEVRESSSGKNAFFPTMYLLHLHLGFRVASGFILFSRLTHLQMPYAVSVRQVSGLPPASFRSRLAADTLALAWCYPLHSGLSPVRTRSCRAHYEKSPNSFLPGLSRFKMGQTSVRLSADRCKDL